MKIRQYDAHWFSRWASFHDLEFPADYQHVVGVAGPGAKWQAGRGLPCIDENESQASLSENQKHLIDDIIFRFHEGSILNIAIYAGYFHEDWGESYGFNDSEGVFIFGERFNYMLYSIDGAKPFAYYEERWGSAFAEISMIWPLDRSWCLIKYPDVPYALIAANDAQILTAILNEPQLGSRRIS